MGAEMSAGTMRLLKGADEFLVMAKDFQAAGRDGDAMACAMFAAEYVRAAKAVQAAHEAANSTKETNDAD